MFLVSTIVKWTWYAIIEAVGKSVYNEMLFNILGKDQYV